VTGLSISAGASVDLTSKASSLHWRVGTLVDDVRAHLSAGRLITSSGVTDSTGLGYADNAALDSVKTAWVANRRSVRLLIKFAYFGDTDLDGDIDV
jgi:hypothetical protein